VTAREEEHVPPAARVLPCPACASRAGTWPVPCACSTVSSTTATCAATTTRTSGAASPSSAPRRRALTGDCARTRRPPCGGTATARAPRTSRNLSEGGRVELLRVLEVGSRQAGGRHLHELLRRALPGAPACDGGLPGDGRHPPELSARHLVRLRASPIGLSASDPDSDRADEKAQRGCAAGSASKGARSRSPRTAPTLTSALARRAVPPAQADQARESVCATDTRLRPRGRLADGCSR
jgi:hypothetical protein